MKKNIFRVLAIVLTVICILSCSVSASSIYKSYVYDNDGSGSIAPDAFRFDSVIKLSDIKDNNGKSIGSLNFTEIGNAKDPGNMFVSDSGLIYIADTGNKRIVVLNSDFSYNRIITGFKNTIKMKDGSTKTFNDTFSLPAYVFVDDAKDGNIYICDQNGATVDNVDEELADVIEEGTSGRVIELDKNGNFIRQIAGVTSEILPDDFIFQPRKITVDSAGRIFILSRQCIQGILELSESGKFVQCLGAAKATYSVAELFKRMFMTEAQRKSSENFVSSEYSGITVDEDNFLYVTNMTFEKSNFSQVERLRKINAKGGNVLRKVSSTVLPYGDSKAAWTGSYKGPSKLIDVMTLDDGVYAVLDQLRGRVFFYNNDGVNLFEFGTKPDTADNTHTSYLEGMLLNPISMAWKDDQCLVLDAETGWINIYTMTDYAKLILEANHYHSNDKWDEEEQCWLDVLKVNANSTAAKQSIGKVYYRQKDYDTAMSYFEEINDTDNYSLSYKYKRQIIINDYFVYGLIFIILLIVLISVGKRLYKKYVPPVKPDSYFGHLKYAGTILSRPLNGSWFLVRENHASIASATTILLAASIVSLLQARFTGFIFSPQAKYVNILLEMLKIILPVLLFCICNWCVTSLMNGEGNFKAIYIGTCYSLTPIIILYPIAIIFSNVMLKEEGNFFATFVTIGVVLTFLLIFAINMRIHDYGPGFTIVELAITLVVMLLVVFLAVLFFALVQQMFDFASRLLEELATR